MSGIPAPELPVFQAASPRDAAALDASRAVLALFLRTGSAGHSVRDLARHTGLSERTFYRYFPRKEDAIRPYVEAGLAHVLGRVRDVSTACSLRDALVGAHAEVLDAARAHGGEVLLSLLEGDERLSALWLRLLADAELAFAAVIAERCGLDPRSLPARAAGAAVVAAGRLALRPAGSQAPGAVFAAALDLFGSALPAAPPEPAQRS